MKISLSQALDRAVDKLPIGRRLMYKARLRSSRFRQSVLDELASKLNDDPAAPFSAFGENHDEPFSIDVNNLEQFLELILKYLPQIIALFTNLFSSFIMFAILFVGSTAEAQCPNGSCPVRQTVQTVVAAPIKVVRNVAPSIAPVLCAPSVAPVPTAPVSILRSVQHNRVSQVVAPAITPQRSVQYQSFRSATHWSYPGSIDQHLQTGHGVSTAGMTREQMLDLHDSLHENGRAIQSSSYTRSVITNRRSGPVRRALGY